MEREVAAAVCPITVEEDDCEDMILAADQWVNTTSMITLDSGCCEHVMDISDAPGYRAFIDESAGSKRRQNFVVGNGQKVPNEGEITLNLAMDGRPLQSTFQDAGVTRPLMSVGRVCDQGLDCLFSKSSAKILSAQGEVLAVFERDGGLYTSTMRLKAPKRSEGVGGHVDPSGLARPEP